jgi:tetratricopeptide (TPR) repeat protein
MKSSHSILLLFLVLTSCATTPKTPLTGDLAGVVYDLDKTPVAAANIRIISGDKSQTAVTDVQGRFTFSSIEVGTYSLSFSKAMYETHSWTFEITDFTDALYLQTASYWQLLDSALDSLGRKEWNEASEYLSRARTIQDASTTSLFLEAVLNEKKGDIAAAEECIKRALDIDNNSAYLWLYIADLYEGSSASEEKIIEALTRYLELRDDPVAAERLSRMQK